jgi:electron transport complex protein RnfG
MKGVKDILKIAAILSLVCGLAAGSLSFVNAATKDRIAAFAKEETIAALKKIFPTAETFTELPPANEGAEVTDWDAVAADAVIGSVHRLQPMGYSGAITLVFGQEASGALTGVQVLNHTETPGLGAKITTDAWAGQFKGLTRDDGGGQERRSRGRCRRDRRGHDLLARGHPGGS